MFIMTIGGGGVSIFYKLPKTTDNDWKMYIK